MHINCLMKQNLNEQLRPVNSNIANHLLYLRIWIANLLLHVLLQYFLTALKTTDGNHFTGLKMVYRSILVLVTLVCVGASEDKEEARLKSPLKSNGGFKLENEFTDDNKIFFNEIPGLPPSRYSEADKIRWVNGHNRRRRTEGAANMKKLVSVLMSLF